MSFNKMKVYVKDEGYCCPFALLRDRRLWKTSVMAEDAGMTPRGVWYWREAEHAGKVRCRNYLKCQKALLRRPE